MRIPRKLKKKIPKDTPYCYSPDIKENKQFAGLFTYGIKSCPFYKSMGRTEGWCRLIRDEVMDQCKSCGVL